jgi:DNA-binding response OmpR family regulator
MSRILIIEDEAQLARGLVDDLTLEGYEVEARADGDAGAQCFGT